MKIDENKVKEALKQISISVSKKHVYDAIINTHPFRFADFDNLPLEDSEMNRLEQTMKIANYMVFVHSCTSIALGDFLALKIIEYKITK